MLDFIGNSFYKIIAKYSFHTPNIQLFNDITLVSYKDSSILKFNLVISS